MHFEWDRAKADSNRKKHGVTFDEAVTVFPQNKVRQSASSAQDPLRRTSADAMKRKPSSEVAEMRAEYSFDYSKAERGRYYKRLLKEGSNVVVLDRDVARAFPDSASVNKALRSVLKSRRPRRLATRLPRARDKASRAG